jgi:hypothetical protein
MCRGSDIVNALRFITAVNQLDDLADGSIVLEVQSGGDVWIKRNSGWEQTGVQGTRHESNLYLPAAVLHLGFDPNLSGVWAVVDNANYGEQVSEVHSEEIDALRQINGRGYGRVIFLPWGMTLQDAERASS